MTITWLWFDAYIESFFLSAPGEHGWGIPLDSGFRGEWKVAGCHCGVLDAYCQQHHGAGRATLKLKGRKLPEIVASKKCWMEVFGRWKSELSILFHTSPHAVVSCRCPCISFSFQSMYAKGYVHWISDWINKNFEDFSNSIRCNSSSIFFSNLTIPRMSLFQHQTDLCGGATWATCLAVHQVEVGGQDKAGVRIVAQEGSPFCFFWAQRPMSGGNDNPHLHPVAGHALIYIYILISDIRPSKEIPTDLRNIPQTLNHLFMKEILSYFITFVFWGTWGMLQGSVEIFLETYIQSGNLIDCKLDAECEASNGHWRTLWDHAPIFMKMTSQYCHATWCNMKLMGCGGHVFGFHHLTPLV